MPNNQINKGYDFSTGQLVTADNLDALAQEATLRRGAITEQPAQTDAVSASDLIVIDDVSDLSATTPKKATIQQVFAANLPVTTSSISGTNSKVDVIATDGTVVTGATYSFTGGNVVTVTSNAHGLLKGDFVEVTCTSTLGDSGTKFSGRFCVQTVTNVNTFTYRVIENAVASSGTASWKRSGTLAIAASARTAEDLEVEGNAEIKGVLNLSGTRSLIIPRGTSAQRPANAIAGEIRYNTELSRLENYNGTAWKEMGASPFEASGGNIVLQPNATTTAAVFTSNGTYVTVTDTNLPNQPAALQISEGQIVEIVSQQPNYTKFEGPAYEITSTTFKVKMPNPQAAFPGAFSCTYRKSGNHKVHIFTTSGSFQVVGDTDAYVEVLVVGGGGGSIQSIWAGGGAGGFAYVKSMPLQAGVTYPVIVGAAGVSALNQSSNAAMDGGNSSFNGVIAYGGKKAKSISGFGRGGDSGGNNIGNAGMVITNTNASYSGAGAYGEHFNAQRYKWSDSDANNYAWFGLHMGMTSDITNISKLYSAGGMGGEEAADERWGDYTHAFPSECYSATDPWNALPNNGCGGMSALKKPTNTNDWYGQPSSGIVVIRYAYKLST